MIGGVFEMIPKQQIGFLVLVAFLAGRQLGHVGAKYARAKKSSRIVFGVLMLIFMATLIYTFK